MCKISFFNPSLEGSVGHIFFCLFGAPFPRSTLEPGRLSRRDALRMSAGCQRGTWAPGEFWAPGELGAPGAQRVGGYLGDTGQRGGNIVVIFLWSQTGRFQSNELGISKYD